MVVIDGIDEADYDLLPDYLKEDSVVESPFGFEDIVLPIGFEGGIWDYSVEGIKKASLDSPPINLTKKQRKTLDNIKADLYNWGAEPSYSDIFHKEFCNKNDISLSVLKTLEKKGLIKLAKDDYYFKTDGYIIYATPLMYAFYITEEDDFPEWFIPDAKEKGLWKAESKKMNPLEKAGISGVASGATIEGLSALMGADSIEKKYFTRYGFSEGGKEWGEISFEWMPTVNEWMPYNEDDPLSKNDLELFRKEKEYELVNEMLKNEKSRLHTFYINNPYHVDEEEFDTKYEVLNEDGEIENLGLLISWDEPEIEYRKSQYSTDPETPLYRFEFLDAEEQSAYWFLKGEMQSRAPLNEMDLEQIMEMLQNVPKKEMDDAIEQAEMMGDEAAMIVLVMADNKRKFREEYASEYENIGTMSVAPARGYTGYMNMMSSARRMVEIGNETGLDQKLGEAYQDESGRWFLPILERKASEEESTEIFKLKSYFTYLKTQKPDLAREIEFSVKNEGELPSQKIYDAGFNPSIIEEWVDLIGVEDENLQPYESCSTCEGEGYILTSYTSATRFDPADGDGEDCGECVGTGMIDPADYMDKEGEYHAETFESEYDVVKTSFKCHNIEYKYRRQSIEERHPDDVWPSMTVSVEHKENIEKYTLESLEDVIREKLENKISQYQGEPVEVLFFSSERLAELQKKKYRGWAAETFNTEYDEEDMVSCRHCWNEIGNEKEVYGDETVDYEMANGELVCLPCHKIWMDEYKNDLDPHYSPFYAEEKESIFKNTMFQAGSLLLALTLLIHYRK